MEVAITTFSSRNKPLLTVTHTDDPEHAHNMAANVEDFKSELSLRELYVDSVPHLLSCLYPMNFPLFPLALTACPDDLPLPSTSTERLDEQDLHIRESWVAAMKARIVRGELIKCQRGEGVNHYKHCRDLAEMYTGMIRENKVSGVQAGFRMSDR
jgi:hypothetical protein